MNSDISKTQRTTGDVAEKGAAGAKPSQLELDVLPAEKRHGLVDYILQNPVRFISDPSSATKLFSDSDFAGAYGFFASQNPSRFVHSVCTAFFQRGHRELNLKLHASGISEYAFNRFWPYWYARNLTDAQCLDCEYIGEVLRDLWNLDAGPWDGPSMFFQTGFLGIEESREIDGFYFFKCSLPVHKSGTKTPGTISICFDPRTRGFYSLNSRVRYEDEEFRWRFLEHISPELNPPVLQSFITAGSERQWKVLLILDRHIGENLSLLSTHANFLAKIRSFDLTLDVSMCPFFKNISNDTLQRFLGTSNCGVSDLPPDRADFDLVFDPYDWGTGVFDLKPQNDTSMVSIVSGIEWARSEMQQKRRNIIEMHMSSLKRMGIVSNSEPVPEFVRYRMTSGERKRIRERGRARLFRKVLSSHRIKLVSVFPYGLSPERRYPVEALQAVVQALLADPDVHVLLAGNDYDTPEIIRSVRNDWPGISHPCRDRVRVFLNEKLPDLIEIMLASDAVVSMDSGPLHLARALRVNPIALYTGKVNSLRRLLLFPWLVDDGTAEVLKPDVGQNHVLPGPLVQAIQKKLNFLPFP